MKPFLTTPDEAVKRLREGTYTVGIFGFGRVGLVIGVGWELAGARIIGMTLDKQALKLLKSGISPFPEEEYLSEYIDGLIRKGLMEVTDDLAYGARSSDIKIIAVPAYLTKEGKPDLSPVKKVAHEISLSLSRGDVVIVETSLPPGTTRDLIKPILEENSGLRADEDFALAYSPERISAGTALKDFLENYPKIIGCDSQRSLELVARLYSAVVKKGVITMSSTVAAEAEKLFEGIYRDVNIALANELATICEKIGICFDEVQRAANSQPFSHLHSPGIGVGGACIPVYPRFVIETAMKHNVKLSLVPLAREINDSVTDSFNRKILKSLEILHLKPSESVFALLGLSFRGGTSDTRLSPSLRVLSFIRRLGGEVKVCDPLVKSIEGETIKIFKEWRQTVRGTDVVIIANDHREFHEITLEEVSDLAGRDAAVLDGKNLIRDLDVKPSHRVLYVGVGRPTVLIEPDGSRKPVGLGD